MFQRSDFYLLSILMQTNFSCESYGVKMIKSDLAKLLPLVSLVCPSFFNVNQQLNLFSLKGYSETSSNFGCMGSLHQVSRV